jgi:acyl-[acyl-carrier-protein]-phospholipid O-acyltransferase / long-chain-fatty-acid--[acyl-carrier-protein] ligase
MSSLKLLFSRRFGAMFACMALGAFNDNFYKNALIIITTYSLAAKMGIEAATLLSVAGAAFILPFFLCSGIAGEVADRVPKHYLVRVLKMTELVIVLMAIAALMFQHTWSLMATLFMLGMQAAVFGPAKYSILPELVHKDELLQGNAMVEGGTFISILLGTLVGGLLILRPSGIEIVSIVMLTASLLGVWAAWRVPVTHVKSSDLKINYNIFVSTWRMVRHAFENPGLIFPILDISWFWAIGATYLTQIPVFTKEIIGADEKVVTLFNGVFTVGIALGSFYSPLAIKWLGARAKNLSAIALSGVLLFGLDLCWVGYHATPPAPDELIGFVAYLTSSFSHLRLALDLFLMAFCGGMFIVPLYTQMQVLSAEHERARTIASNNVLNAFFIATASVLAAVLFALDVNVLQVLFIFALLNIPVIATLTYSAYKKRAQ